MGSDRELALSSELGDDMERLITGRETMGLTPGRAERILLTGLTWLPAGRAMLLVDPRAEAGAMRRMVAEDRRPPLSKLLPAVDMVPMIKTRMTHIMMATKTGTTFTRVA